MTHAPAAHWFGPASLARACALALITSAVGCGDSPQVPEDALSDGPPGAAPSVTAVSAVQADGSYGLGATLELTVTFTSPVVVVGGAPTLALETGGIDRLASYSGGAGTSTLTFGYTVQEGDEAPRLDYLAADALAAGGATLRDASAQDAILTLPAPGTPGSLAAGKALLVDGVAPAIAEVRSSTPDGSYGSGATIELDVVLTEPVTVTGAPTLLLETGDTDRTATYASGSGTTSLRFTYAVQAGDTSEDLDYAGTSALSLGGGTIADAAVNPAQLALAEPGSATSLAGTKQLVIDSVAPTVTKVSSAKPDGTYGPGTTIRLRVTFSEAVAVTGTPVLTLETGTTDRDATYESGAGSNVLVFLYTVQASDASADLDYVATTALAGGTITDLAGNPAVRALAAPGASGSLGFHKALVIEPNRPTIVRVGSPKNDGHYGLGEAINVRVTFSEPVTVTGTPTLTLETGAVDRVISYASGTGTNNLVFQYVVQAGDQSLDLDYVSSTALVLAGGSIRDVDTNDAVLTLPPPSACDGESLAANKNLMIETAALVVRPRYLAAPHWNDYVKAADPTLACDATDAGRGACLHGGERRRVVTTEPSCTGVTLTDALGVFDWSCQRIGGVAVFTSSLRPGKGLRDLVTASGWKANAVTLTGGSGGASVPAAWWRNAVTPLPDNSTGTGRLPLESACTIYTLAASDASAGIELAADEQALVSLPGAQLSFSGTSSEPKLVTAPHRQAWIEVEVTAGVDSKSVSALRVTGDFARVHGSKIAGHASGLEIWGSSGAVVSSVVITAALSGLYVSSVDGAEVSDVRITGSDRGKGIELGAAQDVAVRDVRIANAFTAFECSDSDGASVSDFTFADGGGHGLRLLGCDKSRIWDGRVYGFTYGIMVNGAENRLSRLVVSGADSGLTLVGAAHVLTGLTIANIRGQGVNLMDTPGLVMATTLLANGGAVRMVSGSATATTTIAQLAAGTPSAELISINGGAHKFTGRLLLNDSTRCAVTGAISGVVDGTCANQGASDAELVTSPQLWDGLVGKITGGPGDGNNGSDAQGAAIYAQSLDWWAFDNAYRAWGRDGSAFPNEDHRGACTTGTCRIWDFRAVLEGAVTSATLVGTTPAFVAADDCPTSGAASLDTAKYVMNPLYPTTHNGHEAGGDNDGLCEEGETCTQRFLRGALELFDDGVGDDDGLCESNEACLFTPNFGAYQGEGALGTCTFTDGRVRGVLLHGYASAGALPG